MFFSLCAAHRAALHRAAAKMSRPAFAGALLSSVLLASCSATGDGLTGPTPPTGPSGPGAAALIDLSVPAVTLNAIGTTENISATIRDATGRTLTAPSVTWSSENPTIADVAGGGGSAAIIARAPGVTRIRASAGTAAAFVDVRVLGVRAISISPAVTSVRVGDLQPLRVSFTGDAGASQSVRWSTLNPSIATVDASGIVTGVGIGTTTVRVSAVADPNILATAEITVTPPRGIALAPGLDAITLWVGDSRTVPVEVDLDATQVRTLLWSSGNLSVATVNASGAIAAVGAGSTIITVTALADPRAKAELLLTVLPARRVLVSPAALALGVQQQATLTASVTLEPGLSTAVNWTTSDPSVAAVSAAGIVTGYDIGVAVITATSLADPTKSGTSVVSVSASVRSVSIAPSTVSSFVGDQDQLVADVVTDGPIARTVTWRSSNSGVASISTTGALNSVAAGTATITAVSTVDTTKRATAQVTVVPAPLVGITPTQASIAIGEQRTFSGRVTVSPGLSTAVIWRSSDQRVATVDASGQVTGVGLGTSSITIRSVADSTRIATATVTVVPIVRSVTLTPSNATGMVGEVVQMTAAVVADGPLSRAVTFRSSNVLVATVSSQGTVAFVGGGQASITAIAVADTTRRATAMVNVSAPSVQSVSLSPGAASLFPSAVQQLNAVVIANGGLSTAVVFRSSAPAIASVSPVGLVTAHTPGTAIITALSVADTTKRAVAQITVTPPSVQSVRISPTTASLQIGGTQLLAASITSSGGLPTTAAFRSSAPAVATVGSNGLVTAISAGTATITAMASADTTKQATSTITVVAAGVLSIAISPTSDSLLVGQSQSVTASVVATGGLPTTVIFRTNAAGVATVSASGLVTAVGAGTATITAIATADTTKRATATITVVAPAVQSVTISPTSASLMVGQSQALNAVVTTTGGLPTTVVFRTSAPGVATVSASGVVSAVSGGSALITAMATADTSRQATATITVASAVVQSITISPTSGSLLIGQAQAFTASVITTGGLPTTVTYRTSAPSVATVNGTGAVTAVGVGAATITAVATADTTKRASATLTVTPRPVVVTVSPRPVSLDVGATQQLSASVTGDPGINTAVTWSSASASIAAVNASGLVTAVASGSAVILATSVADPARRDTVTVAVSSTQLATTWASVRLGGALYEEILSTVGFGTASAFAVNIVGDVYRFDGANWTLSTTGAQHGGRFQAVHGSSASNVIAVGSNGIAARFNGSSWTTMSSGTTNALNDVWVEGASAAFAVGGNGTAVRFNGSSWATTSTGSAATLNAVWTTSGASFAVGGAGAVLRYSSGAWTPLASNTSETLYGVSGTSANDVVAVGSVGTIVRFDGTSFAIVANSVSSGDLYSVDGTSVNNGRMYLGGDAGLLQLDGTTLSLVATPYRPRLITVSADAIGTVWVGGQRGAVMRLSGGSWTTVNLAPDLLDVWSSSSSNAWAVGEFGFVYRWSGTAWTRQSTPTTVTLNTVWGASTSDAFAGGDNGTMLRFNGSSWTAMSFPSTATVTGLWGSSSSNVYATTSSGQVLRFTGASWSVVATNATPLWGVFGLASGEVYVSGDGGALLRFNGSGWTSSSPTGSGTLAGVWGSTSSNLFSVGVDGSGAAGYAFRFNGSAWSSVNVGTPRLLTSVWGPAQNDVYATGDLGTMLRFNGSSWQMMPTGTTDLLWSVTGAPTGGGGAFAVGYNGTMATGTRAATFRGSAMRTVTRGSLEPSAAARVSRDRTQPLPEGQARRQRKTARAALVAPARAVARAR